MGDGTSGERRAESSEGRLQENKTQGSCLAHAVPNARSDPTAVVGFTESRGGVWWLVLKMPCLWLNQEARE